MLKSNIIISAYGRHNIINYLFCISIAITQLTHHFYSFSFEISERLPIFSHINCRTTSNPILFRHCAILKTIFDNNCRTTSNSIQQDKILSEGIKIHRILISLTEYKSDCQMKRLIIPIQFYFVFTGIFNVKCVLVWLVKAKDYVFTCYRRLIYSPQCLLITVD